MKNILSSFENRHGFARAIIFLLLLLCSVQVVLAYDSVDDIFDIDSYYLNYYITRGEYFVEEIRIKSKIPNEIWMIEDTFYFEYGGEVWLEYYDMESYESNYVIIIYDTRDEYLEHKGMNLYEFNPPQREMKIVSIYYCVVDDDNSGIITFFVPLTILPDKNKGPAYNELAVPGSFDVSVCEGETAKSVLKIKGVSDDKLSVVFEPERCGNGGETTFLDGGNTEWADSPDGYYELKSGNETEIKISYCTSDEVTGKSTPPGEYDYTFKLYYWTNPGRTYKNGWSVVDEENQNYGIIEIPYHLTVLPKSSSVPEFPINPLYAGILIFGVFSLLAVSKITR